MDASTSAGGGRRLGKRLAKDSGRIPEGAGQEDTASPEDNWYQCRCGSRHWGPLGTAGLLVSHGDRVLLQLRSANSHNGGTWGLPGGARRAAESPLKTALREASEEAGLDAERLSPTWWVIADHVGWTYTTIAAQAEADPLGGPSNWETTRLEWVEPGRVAGFNLHPGLRQMWPTLELLVAQRATLIVDAANVMGSRPDGWWKDRAGAARRLRDELEPLAVRGLANTASTAPAGWYPQLVLVVEGQARGIGQGKNVTVVDAPGEGDDEIVAQARAAVARGAGPVEVVTADKGLTARLVAAGATVMRPGGLLQVIR